MNNDNELTVKEVTALLATGQLPDVAAKILAEANARWSVEPPSVYSFQAQQAKIDKAFIKRMKRAAKRATSSKDMDNETFTNRVSLLAGHS